MPADRPGLQSKISMPSRIGVIGNHLPRQCGIATFTTDLCAALSASMPAVQLMAPAVTIRDKNTTIRSECDGRWPKTTCKSYESGQVSNFNNSTWCACQSRVWNLLADRRKPHAASATRLANACGHHAAHSFYASRTPISWRVMEEIAAFPIGLIVMSQFHRSSCRRYSRCRAARSTWCRTAFRLPSRSQFHKDASGRGKSGAADVRPALANKGIEKRHINRSCRRFWRGTKT